jgi:hypothetical protein
MRRRVSAATVAGRITNVDIVCFPNSVVAPQTCGLTRREQARYAARSKPRSISPAVAGVGTRLSEGGRATGN